MKFSFNTVSVGNALIQRKFTMMDMKMDTVDQAKDKDIDI
jgi:hypothetical protein